MAQERLDDVQVAIRLPHQLGAQGVAESVRAHLVATDLGQLLIEALYLPGIHRLHSVADAESVHVEDLLAPLDTHRPGRVQQILQMWVESIGDGHEVLPVILCALPGSGENAALEVDILGLHQQKLSQSNAGMIERFEHGFPEPDGMQHGGLPLVSLDPFI